MKKTLSLILALLMSISTASVAFASEEVAIEDEVAVEEVVTEEEVVAGPYDEAIKYLGRYGIYKGVSEDDLAAEADVNRWQMALFAARLSTGWVDDDTWEDGPLNSSEFTDLAGTAAADYYGAISYVNQKGIIEGYGDGTYGPLKGITYQDALTIVVRTLGYKNLAYPWGYIQKAVELGLTEGVVDVTFTDALTRGETAQIIYNALNADGGKLGLEVFGIMVADVVIVSSDRDVLGTNKTAPASFVGFQIVDNGELDETVYYAKAADFGLEGHEDDLAVGASFKVYLEVEDDDLAAVVYAEPNYVETIWNLGKTDDESVAVDTYAIADALTSKYTVKTAYSANYIGNAFAAKGEIIVVDALGGIVELVATGINYGIDMNTGDIVVYEKNEAGEIEVEVVYYYNQIVDAYYEVVFDADKKEVGIKYITDAKMLEAIEKSAWKEAVTSGKGFATALKLDQIDTDSAYASLDVYEVNDKFYGIYEEYKFGYFANGSTKRCGCNGDPARDTYTISNKLMYATVDGKNAVLEVTAPATFDMIVEGQCNCEVGAWINPEFAANATETGYADGYVIYSADKQTGEIKIVKYINDCEDADTYVGKGSIKAFSATEEYVVIGGEKLYFDYDNLEGTGLYNVSKNSATKGEYSALLRDLFGQYVEYVVVDGEIVYIKVLGNTTTNLFVVEKYAGISSNGYITVDGYWTGDAATLTRAQINSYNNNYTGDPFYYMNTDKAKAAFTKGAIYAVSSTEEDGSLNVQLAGKFDDNGNYTVVNKQYVNLGNEVSIKSDDNAKNGYIYIDNKLTRDKGNTYILIGAEDREGFAPIAVYTGKVTAADWWAEGTRVNGLGDNTYLLVNANWQGFGRDMGSAGLVALLGDYYWTADFDGNATEDWYLLGASEYEVEVFDFYTGSSILVGATNLDLEAGYIYRTIDDTLVYDDEIVAADLYKELVENYLDTDAFSADYLFGNVEVTAANYDTIKTTISHAVSQNLFGKNYDDLCNKVEKAFIITTKGDKIASIKTLDKDVIKALAADNGLDTVTLNGFYIYNNDTTNAILYVYADVTGSTATGSTELVSDQVIEAGKDAYIVAVGEISTTITDKVVTGATLDALTIKFAGKAIEEDTHQAIENKSYYFGNAGLCDFEDWNCTVNGKPVYGTIVAEVYEEHDTEEVCNLIKAVEFKDLGLTLVEGAWQYAKINFTNNFGTASNFTIAALLMDGSITVRIDNGSAYGSFNTVVNTPAGLLVK